MIKFNQSNKLIGVYRLAKISTENCSVVALDAEEEFIGEAFLSINYSKVGVNVFSDVSSAEDGLLLQGSVDGISFYDFAKASTIGGTLSVITEDITLPYFRIKFKNGAEKQTSFMLHSVLRG